MPPQILTPFSLPLQKSVCDFMSIMSLLCHLVSRSAVMASLYSVNRESKDSRASVLNNVRTFHVPKINSFTLQPGRRLLIPSEASLRFSEHRFFPGWGRYPHAQPPTWRTRVSLFVWVITFDLSGLGDCQ
jgi:hypothetical protein